MAGVVDMDRGWAQLLQNVQRTPRLAVKVGWPEETTGGQPHGHDAISNAGLAQLQEFGSADRTVRPTGRLAATFDAHRPEIEQRLAQLAGDVLVGKGDLASGLDAIGAWFAGRLRAAFNGGSALAPPSSSRPPTGALRNAISWVVVSAA